VSVGWVGAHAARRNKSATNFCVFIVEGILAESLKMSIVFQSRRFDV